MLCSGWGSGTKQGCRAWYGGRDIIDSLFLGKYRIPQLRIPVTLFAATQNRFYELESNTAATTQLRQLVQQEQQQLLQSTQQQTQQHDLGWRDILGKWLNIVVVPGDHYTMLLKPNAEEFARVLMQELSAPTQGIQLVIWCF